MAELSAEAIGKTLSARPDNIQAAPLNGASCLTPLANVAGGEFTGTAKPQFYANYDAAAELVSA